MWWMSRDGFTFLVSGFTGKEAAQWKERYIDAFNRPEKKVLTLTHKRRLRRCANVHIAEAPGAAGTS